MSRTVLVVDPDSTLREWERLHLSAAGLDAVAESDPRGAAAVLTALHPGLLILAFDSGFPSATEAASGLCQLAREGGTPVLALAHRSDVQAVASVAALGPNQVLLRPLGGLDLRHAALRLMDEPPASAASAPESALPPSPAIAGPDTVPPGPRLEAKEACLLVLSVRNMVTLARALRANALEALLGRLVREVCVTVADQGGWVVRSNAAGVLAVFDEGPTSDRTPASRAIETGLFAVLSARRARQWAETQLTDARVPPISVGGGVASGTVLVARLGIGNDPAPAIAGPCLDVAQRLDGRGKGLGWTFAVTDAASLTAGSRFQFGRRASLETADHAVIPLVEVTGFNPGAARPGELRAMAEVREAMLANTILARVPGDADARTSELTVLYNADAKPAAPRFPVVPGRTLERLVRTGKPVTAYRARHTETSRTELVKVISGDDVPAAFLERYLAAYDAVRSLEQRNVVHVLDTGKTADLGYVAVEFLSGGSLEQWLRDPMPLGLALNYLAQLCIALDALHEIGLAHGGLRARHIHLREEGTAVIADFNVTERTLENLDTDAHGLRSGARDPVRERADFRSLGILLLGMLSGARTFREEDAHVPGYLPPPLPVELSPLQRCLDGLLGLGSGPAYARGEDVIVELLGLRDVFPFDLGRPATATPER